MITTRLVDARNKQKIINNGRTQGEVALILQSTSQVRNMFKATITTAPQESITIIASTKPSESIIITNIVLAGQSEKSSNAKIQFEDDVNSINQFDLELAEKTSFKFKGFWQGWGGAKLTLLTSGNGKITCVIGYMTINKSATFGQWQADKT